MTPLDYLHEVCRTLSQFALRGRFTATLENESTHPGFATTPVDFHGAVDARTYAVTYTSTPGLFGLTILAGVTKDGIPLVRIGLLSMSTGKEFVPCDYLCEGTEDDGKRLAACLSVALAAGSPQDFRDDS